MRLIAGDPPVGRLSGRGRLAVLHHYLPTPADRHRFVRMVGWAVVLPVLRRRLPLRTLARLMWCRPRAPQRSLACEARVVAQVGLLYRGGRISAGANCLARSLVLYRFLAEQGAEPRLVTGMQRRGTHLAGHAWVTVDGLPVGDIPADTARYFQILIFGPGGTIESPR